MTRHAFCLLLAVGCASPMSSLRDDNRRLTQSVTELRSERRSQDRKLRDLQHQLDKLRADRVTAVIGSMPSLPVEVAAPAADEAASSEASRVVAVTEDGTEIVYEGDAAAGKAATWDDEPSPAPRRAARPLPPVIEIERADRGDRIEVTRRVAARSSRTPTRDRELPSERGADAASAYRAAVELVRSGSYVEGISSLRGFLRAHPRHDYADNAQYWLGEAYYAQKDYPHALAEFRTVIETYPRGNKVPDALLKVGYCYQALGQAEKARAVLEQVVNLYPKTEPAVLAERRLSVSATGAMP